MAEIDDIDLRLIELLQKDARTPQHELAKTVGLAASSVNERIRKLGERGGSGSDEYELLHDTSSVGPARLARSVVASGVR